MIYTITFNPALDYTVQVEKFEIGKINRTKSENILAGGKGLNVSIILKRLGIENTALSFIAGFTGKELERKIRQYNIETEFIETNRGYTRINVKISSLEKNSLIQESETALNGNGPEITENDIEIGKDAELNIFNNVQFNGEKIIAPRSTGTYKFYIRNKSNSDMKYNIKFSDEMKKFVNMKYKLKIDNIYIRGSEENYISIDKLDVNNVTVPKDSVNIFTLEWYWEDDDELDTAIGTSNDRYYTIKLKVEKF